ncbi:MAG TPA: Ku protein [Polyangia bacterium]|nr:Ku protein [Polyangia bacterium]
MARALWSGVMSFGLVNIPVKLQSASRDERPHFHMLHAKDDSPIRYERICEREKKPVPWSEIVKGYEVKKGEMAVLTPDDFKQAALNRSETIDILAFVDAGEIDARYFETPYYLVPAKGGERAYALLRETMRKSGKVAVAQVVLRQSQHLAAVTPIDDALVFTTLRFAHEVVATRELDLPPAKSLNAHEMELAAKLVEGFADTWKPEQYHDKYTENLLAIIKTKTRKGAAPRLGELAPPTPAGEITDLMERLRASLAQGRRGAQPASKAAPAHKPAPARKRGKARGHRHAA